jgi:NAD(P)-dependent dehydrogenase (short-subunit alcohol dehydrogenase family)
LNADHPRGADTELGAAAVSTVRSHFADRSGSWLEETGDAAMKRLEGKVALVSGAARGIGAACARKLAEQGAQVVVADILPAEAENTATLIRESGGTAISAPLDVTEPESWKSCVALAVGTFGGLDILVNNAGVYIPKPIMDTTEEDFAALVAVNLRGVFLGTQISAPELMKPGSQTAAGSSIVNLSSAAGLVGSRNAPVYSMTKGGVRLFTKSAALEFARKGIRCNSVHPGLIDTPMGAMVFGTGSAAGNDLAREAMAKAHPLGRIGHPEDIAACVLFLASDEAAFVTGAELAADGGVTAI